MSLHSSLFTPPYRQIALFASNFALGIESARTLPRAFSIALRSLHHTAIRRALVDPVEAVRSGTSIADALRPAEAHLPAFVIPAIQAGEETGRLEASLEFLKQHCHLLSGPAKVIRNAWLLPLAILFAGDAACVLMLLGMGAIPAAFTHLGTAAVKWLIVVALIAIVRQRGIKPYFDRLRLKLPGYRALEQDMASHRFFRVMSLLHGDSSTPVDRQIDIAANSISNTTARQDFQLAAIGIRNQETVTEAFARVSLMLDPSQQVRIAEGDALGTLETVFAQLADAADESLQRKLQTLERASYRIAILAIVAALTGVAWSLNR